MHPRLLYSSTLIFLTYAMLCEVFVGFCKTIWSERKDEDQRVVTPNIRVTIREPDYVTARSLCSFHINKHLFQKKNSFQKLCTKYNENSKLAWTSQEIERELKFKGHRFDFLHWTSNLTILQCCFDQSTAQKCTKMKYARATRASRARCAQSASSLVWLIKYANLLRSCCRHCASF